MLIAALVLTGLAALIHLYVFWLESLVWTGVGRKVFGTSEAEAEATKELAFNQGFYNLFLAVGVVVGTVLIAADERAAGAALVFAGAGSMVSAGLVLYLSSPDKRDAALKQLVLPLIGIVLLVLAL